MRHLISLLLVLTLCSCANVQQSAVERRLATELTSCLEAQIQQRLYVLEERLQSAIFSSMAEQCMEGGQELAARLNSCVDILLSEECNLRAYENISVD